MLARLQKAKLSPKQRLSVKLFVPRSWLPVLPSSSTRTHSLPPEISARFASHIELWFFSLTFSPVSSICPPPPLPSTPQQANLAICSPRRPLERPRYVFVRSFALSGRIDAPPRGSENAATSIACILTCQTRPDPRCHQMVIFADTLPKSACCGPPPSPLSASTRRARSPRSRRRCRRSSRTSSSRPSTAASTR